MQMHPEFQFLIEEFLSSGLAAEQATIYGMWPDLTLAYTNDGWDRFASQNGGDHISTEFPLGAMVPHGISANVRQFFIDNYRRCLEEIRPWEHLYECSSPEAFRLLQMTVFPLGQREGLLVVNASRIEQPHARQPRETSDDGYRDKFGLAHQCVHCRRVRQADNIQTWDWIADWEHSPPKNTSHGLCAACAAYYYFARDPKIDSGAQPFRTAEPWIAD
jgi:hypothetical protein